MGLTSLPRESAVGLRQKEFYIHPGSSMRGKVPSRWSPKTGEEERRQKLWNTGSIQWCPRKWESICCSQARGRWKRWQDRKRGIGSSSCLRHSCSLRPSDVPGGCAASRKETVMTARFTGTTSPRSDGHAAKVVRLYQEGIIAGTLGAATIAL